MISKAHTILRAFLGALLGILGFSGCETTERVEYGTPTSDYKVQGVVKDESGTPIKGARAILRRSSGTGESRYTVPEKDTLYTDSNGKFSFESDFSLNNEVDDIFYSAEGFREDSTTNIRPTQTKPADGWYTGEFIVSDEKTLKKDSK